MISILNNIKNPLLNIGFKHIALHNFIMPKIEKNLIKPNKLLRITMKMRYSVYIPFRLVAFIYKHE